MSFTPHNGIQRAMVKNLPQMTMSKQLCRAKYATSRLNEYRPDDIVLKSNPADARIAQEQFAIHKHRNSIQAKKNPHLARVLDCPRAFLKNLESRFEAQKKVNPKDPYSFEFGDYGIPVLKDIEEALSEEITILNKKRKLNGYKQQSQAGGFSLAGVLAGVSSVLRNTNPFKAKRDKDLDTGLKFLSELKTDIGNHLSEDSVSYRRLNELAYFSARALGHFDREDLSFFDRNFLRIDRKLLGQKGHSIAREYERYRENDYRIFQKKAGDVGVETASNFYQEAIFNQNKFELASLPVARSMGPGVFMQLISHDIYLMGVSKEPEAADGFNRPGADFYLHDQRHSASIFAKRRVYEMEHNLSDQQIEKLEVMQSVWKQEMIQEKKKLKDKELSYAIGFLSFNHHHDRGIPQLPSSFIPEEHGGVADKLYLALTLSGQPTGFKNPKQTLNKAYDWLREFWLERLPQEEVILRPSYQNSQFVPQITE